MTYSFEVYDRDRMIFHSNLKWLGPIFEFEEFLAGEKHEASELLVRDKIIGRAAALLLVRIGIGRLHAQLLSGPGMEVLEFFDVDFTFDLLVPRIGCMTEELLKLEFNPETAWAIIRERIKSRKQATDSVGEI